MESNKHYDAIVIGAGPAGLTAGIYLSRARLETLIINEGTVGGQMILTHEIANYPGVESISGYQLAGIMKKQAMAFGCDIRSNVSIRNIEFKSNLKSISLSDGGGNSALEEAVSLTKYATKVTIVHQFDHFQAFEHAVEEARANSRIHFIMESAITAFIGNESLEYVDVRNLKNGKTVRYKTDGAFIFIGYIPNTEFLKGKIELNQWGEIVVKNDMSTSIEGVYAAGDSIAKRFRQVTTAVGDGTVAALAASNYLHELKSKQKQLITA